MVSVLDLIVPSLLRERYLFRCSSMTIIMWPFWFVAVLDVIPIEYVFFTRVDSWNSLWTERQHPLVTDDSIYSIINCSRRAVLRQRNFCRRDSSGTCVWNRECSLGRWAEVTTSMLRDELNVGQIGTSVLLTSAIGVMALSRKGLIFLAGNDKWRLPSVAVSARCHSNVHYA